VREVMEFTASKVRWSYILLMLTLARPFTGKRENVVPCNIYLYRYPRCEMCLMCVLT